MTGCSWTSSSNADWLRIDSGAAASGSASVSYSVTANDHADTRTGTLTIAGHSFTVTQSGLASCVLTVSSDWILSAQTGGAANVNVDANGSNCPWSATSSTGWITISSGASSQGSGRAELALQPNPSNTGRKATVAVAGKTVTVTQRGTDVCQPTLIDSNIQVTGFLRPGDCREVISEFLGWQGYVDSYDFEGKAGQAIRVLTRYTTFVTFGKTRLDGPGAQASVVASGQHDVAIPSADSYIIVPETGVYTVRIGTSLPDTEEDYTLTILALASKAEMIAPPAGSKLSGSAVTFSWTGGMSADAYWLDVGSAPGSGNYFGRNVARATSQTVTGLPTDGSAIYATLWTLRFGSWQRADYRFTAAGTRLLTKAAMLTPAPGSTLTGSTVTFSWSAGTGADAYWLDVGTVPGVGDYFGKDMGQSTSQSVTALPTNGAVVHVRLWTMLAGDWQHTDYSYVASGAATRGAISSPAPGMALAGGTATFTWTPGAGVSAFWLDVGPSPGVGAYFGARVGLATAQTVSGLPTNGAAIYVRLWSQIGGTWEYNDYSYTGVAAAATKAVMSSPAPGSTLTGSSVTFGWTAGSGVSAYWLDINASCAGCGGGIFGMNIGLATTQGVTGLPTNGSTLYVRLWSQIGGGWQHNDYTYTAAIATATKGVISSPTPGTALGSSSVTFSWTVGLGVSAYWLDVNASCAGCGGGIFGKHLGLATSQTVAGLPTDGATVYVRLWSQIAGGWQFNDYEYTAAAATATKAVISSPTPGTTLGSSSVTFSWTAGSGVSAYWLDVNASCAGCGGGVFGKHLGLVTSQTVNALPTNGGTVYVRLWSQIGGAWQFNDYIYTATGAAASASMLTPPPGTSLGSSSVTFNWTPGSGATAYWLDVNASCAGCGGGIFGKNVGLATSQTVTGIPLTGVVHVRLWTEVAGTWRHNDYSYAVIR
jgi:hypothetical protein